MGKSRFVDPKKLKRVDLGEGDWIEVPERLAYGTVAAMSNIGETDADKTTALLVEVIKKWNLKDENDAEVAITKDSIERLDVATVTLISETVASMMTLSKKKSIG